MADLPARYRPKDWHPELVGSESELMGVQARQDSDINIPKWEMTEKEDGVLPDEQALLLMSGSGSGQTMDDLPPQGLDLRTHLYDIERTLIRQALERSGGTVAQAARLLQLRRTTLVEKLRKFELLDDRMASEI